MKVLQVTTHFNIGGITNYIFSLSRALQLKNISTVVATSGGNMTEELELAGIKHEKLNMNTKFEFGPKAIISAFKIAGLIKRNNIDIIHAHSRVSQVACRIASLLTGVPYVTTCHGYFKKRSRGVFDTWGVKVVAISEAVKSHLTNDLGIDAKRVEVVYNGVDAEKFFQKHTKEEIEAVKKTLNLTGCHVVGTIGRLSSVKGQQYLIHAAAEIIPKMPKTCIVIVGDGDERLALKNLARSLRIEDHVKILRSDPDTVKFLSIFDVFVFPSIKEGLGIALLEAMAYGLPCVASDIGGITDIIKDPSCGILVPVGDKDEIAEAVMKILNDPDLGRDMGKAASLVVVERFLLDEMAGKIASLYESVTR